VAPRPEAQIETPAVTKPEPKPEVENRSTPISSGLDVQAAPSFSSRREVPAPQPKPTPQPSSSAILSSQSPNLRIEGEGPQAVTLGKPASYSITVKNDGQKDAGEVVLSIALPKNAQLAGVNTTLGTPQQSTDQAGQTRIIWQIERVPAQGEQKLSLVLTPQNSQPFQLAVDWAFRPPSTSTRIDVLQPRLEMQLVGPKEIMYGVTQTYTVVVSNPGTGDAENVSLALAPLSLGQPQAEPQRVGVIAAGEKREFQIEVQAGQAGPLQIRSAATADGGLKAEIAEEIIVRRAKVQVAAQGTRFVYAPAGAAYEVSVSNTGDAPARNLTVAVGLPGGAKYLGGTEGAQSVEGGLRLAIGDLAPGDSRSFKVNCELTVEGRNQLQVQARADGGLVESAVAVTQVETIADLKLSVNDPKGPIPVGEKVAYEVMIRNRGAKAAQNVTVTTQFADGIEPLTTEGAQSSIAGGLVSFQPIARIEPNEEVKLLIYARGVKSGNHIFRTELSSQEPEGRQVAEDTSRYFGDLPASSGSINAATRETLPVGGTAFPR